MGDYSRGTLAKLIAARTPREGATETGVEGLKLIRFTAPMQRTPVVYEPSLCFVARGAKHAHLGDRTFVYDAENYLVCSLTLPVISEVPGATPESPFLGLVLPIDTQVVGQILLEMDDHVKWPEEPPEPSILAGPINDAIGASLTRLVKTMDEPLDRKVLAPGLVREAIYRVLTGPVGHVLRDCVMRDTNTHRIARAVRFLEENCERSIEVEEVARHANMSSSALHHHFKQATTMSPMQFLKTLRLHRARLLLLSGRSAGETAYAVGYGSSSQFSREFRRLFGIPPTQVRTAVTASG